MPRPIARAFTMLAVCLVAAGAFAAPSAAAVPTGPDLRHARLVQTIEFTKSAASPQNRGSSVAAATCLGSAIWQYASATAIDFGPFTTTTRCLDINMRKSTTATWWVAACVIFIDHTSNCNYITELSTSWKTIATNVADNTHFKVEIYIDWQNAFGTTASQLAF